MTSANGGLGPISVGSWSFYDVIEYWTLSNPYWTQNKLMTNANIGLGYTKTRPKTFYDDLDYWVGPTKIRPKSVYDDNNYWAPSDHK
jgi:hypothetical protein